jgi:hypothetical protein
VSALDPDRQSSFPAGHVNAPTFPKLEVPSAEEDTPEALSSTEQCAAAAGQRGSRRTF